MKKLTSLLLLFIKLTTYAQQTSAVRVLNDDKKSIESYQQILKSNSQNQYARYNLGVLFYEQNKVDSALQHFRELYKVNPKFAGINTYLGMCLFAKNDKEATCFYFTKAIKYKETVIKRFNHMSLKQFIKENCE